MRFSFLSVVAGIEFIRRVVRARAVIAVAKPCFPFGARSNAGRQRVEFRRPFPASTKLVGLTNSREIRASEPPNFRSSESVELSSPSSDRGFGIGVLDVLLSLAARRIEQ